MRSTLIGFFRHGIHFRYLTVWVVILSTMFTGACSKDIEGPDRLIRDDSSLYVSLEVNHRSLLLSTHPPYDTVTIKTIPLGVNRVIWRPTSLTELEYDSVLKATPITFISRDSSRVRVSKEGKITAINPTPATGTVMVIASRQINHVTWSCTTQVRVLNIPNPPKIASFTFSMQDSNKVADQSLVPPVITAFDDNHMPIENINIYYFSSQRKTIDFSPNNWNARIRGIGGIMGEAWVKASAYVYGTTVVDSIRIRNGYPVTKNIDINLPSSGGGFSVIQVGPGVTINWNNYSNQAVDVIFDQPEKILEAGSPYPASGSGNILSIPGDSTLSLPQRQRYRRVTAPGTYSFSIEPLGYRGTFIVREF